MSTPASVFVGKAGGGPGNNSGTSRCIGRQGCVSSTGTDAKRLASNFGTLNVIDGVVIGGKLNCCFTEKAVGGGNVSGSIVEGLAVVLVVVVVVVVVVDGGVGGLGVVVVVVVVVLVLVVVGFLVVVVVVVVVLVVVVEVVRVVLAVLAPRVVLVDVAADIVGDG